ncbi:MAG: 4-(gamma-glutamylamino)butanal dehydrogenase, partial [Frankiaceae bacterium]|nr:4-(gamma-glutamylamino)butanal dehydrogenase [Frankiaceae bacterium]
ALGWRTELLVNGRWVAARSDDQLSVVSPRDNSVVGCVGAASAEDVDDAVRAARAAFDDGRWADRTPSERGRTLIRFASLIERDAEELALRISLEVGKPVRDALQVELAAVVRCLRWYGEIADKITDETLPTGPDSLGLVTRGPAGGVGAVVPWNFPLTMTAWKLGPALVAGNSVVLKPAEQTPFSALELGALALEAGLPEGVLNVLPGRGPVAGEALGRHPDVDVLTFTGSVAVGRAFQRYAAESNGKRVWPELGGKSGSVILPDADIEKAARTTAWGCFYNSGQMCSASSRLIVHRDVADEVVAFAVAEAERMTPADPLDWDAPLGPVVSEHALERVLAHARRAVEQGATVAYGSVDRYDIGTGTGAYVRPMVLTGVTPDMSIAQEEVFGPVLSVLVVNDVDEAVRVANDTRFGLAAALWTNDLSAAHRVSRRLRAGTVWVNCFEEGGMSLPFGGVKASGFGRDKGAHAMDKYSDMKSTWIELAQ